MQTVSTVQRAVIDKVELDKLRTELSIKAKNGINFIFAASIVWCFIAWIWTWELSAFAKSIYTFYAGCLLLPIAFIMSKIFKTAWSVKDNPLEPLGLWLNFAQLFYFPFLIFVLLKVPDYFVMAYAIITGAHLFPYSWFYKNRFYAIFAGVVSVTSLILGIRMPQDKMFILPLVTGGVFAMLTVLLYFDYRQKAETL